MIILMNSHMNKSDLVHWQAIQSNNSKHTMSIPWGISNVSLMYCLHRLRIGLYFPNCFFEQIKRITTFCCFLCILQNNYEIFRCVLMSRIILIMGPKYILRKTILSSDFKIWFRSFKVPDQTFLSKRKNKQWMF